MSIRLVLIETASGIVLGDWVGDEQNQPIARAGRQFIATDEDVTGKRWDGSAFVAAPVVPARRITPITFARLFTRVERIAIRDRRVVADPAAKVIEDFYSLLELAGSVDLDHPDVTAGLDFMVTNGLLTDARRVAILAGQPPS